MPKKQNALETGGGHWQVVLDGQPSRWKAGACLLKQSDI